MDPTKDTKDDVMHYVYLAMFLFASIVCYVLFTLLLYELNRADEDEFLRDWSELNGIDISIRAPRYFSIDVPVDTDIDILKHDINRYLTDKFGELSIEILEHDFNHETRGLTGHVKSIGYYSSKIEYEEYSTRNAMSCSVHIYYSEIKTFIDSLCRIESYWTRWNKPAYGHAGTLGFITWKNGWYNNVGQSVYKSYLLAESIKNNLKLEGDIYRQSWSD